MTHGTHLSEATISPTLRAQARDEAERRLSTIDIEEARACGKTEEVVTSVAVDEQVR